jgi:pimeloyl-ACP methyl ester carboxylesterase
MLPRKFPNARIFAFNYPFRWHQDVPSSRAEIIAETLLDTISRLHKESGRARPIVFIGHSYGGVVIAQAISTVSIPVYRYGDILKLIAGAIFLGTPFRGGANIRSSTGRQGKGTWTRSHGNARYDLQPRNPVSANREARAGKTDVWEGC